MGSLTGKASTLPVGYLIKHNYGYHGLEHDERIHFKTHSDVHLFEAQRAWFSDDITLFRRVSFMLDQRICGMTIIRGDGNRSGGSLKISFENETQLRARDPNSITYTLRSESSSFRSMITVLSSNWSECNIQTIVKDLRRPPGFDDYIRSGGTDTLEFDHYIRSGGADIREFEFDAAFDFTFKFQRGI
jgi:hypothetical protein